MLPGLSMPNPLIIGVERDFYSYNLKMAQTTDLYLRTRIEIAMAAVADNFSLKNISQIICAITK
jgi:hypothetical protein